MRWFHVFVAMLIGLVLAACQSTSPSSAPARVTTAAGDGSLQRRQLQAQTVECRLVDARAAGDAAVPVSLSAYACAQQGGQYVAADARADLVLWLPLAQAGDPVAQTRVGLIYELGLVGSGPDYDSAATWYRRATRADFAPALVRFAGMHDRGLGVKRNPDTARDLLRRASRGRETPREAPRLFIVEPSIVLATARNESGVLRASLARPARDKTLVGRALAQDELLRTIEVNGRGVAVDREGYFELPAAQWREAERLSIVATDSRGARTQLDLSVAARGGLPAPAAAPVTATPVAPTGRRVALLIGNQDYRHAPRLDTPLNDVRELQRVLERRYGFAVTLLANASRRDLLGALNALRGKLKAEDQLLVFYAGHGEVDPVTERGYWIPVEARTDDRTQWVSNVEVSDLLLAVEARQVLLVIDSCFGGSFNRRALPGGDAELAVQAAQAAQAAQDNVAGAGAVPRTRWAMTSGGLEPVSDGAGGRHSLYAGALLDVLETLDAPLAARGLFDEVNARFRRQLMKLQMDDQRPRFAPVKLAGHQGGEFVLAPRSAVR